MGGKQRFLWVHPPDEFAPLTGSRELAQMSSPCRTPASLAAGRRVWRSVLGDPERGFIPRAIFPGSGTLTVVRAESCSPDR